jgi:NADH-quinone oxidoreductase subunit G
MVTVYIDNIPHEVDEGTDLLSACLSLGFNIPYFCWHPALRSAGACRQCAVKQFKDEKDTRGRIIMSCMTPVEDGMRISIEDPEVREFRARVIEWLMLNHPHDCPVCDEGGECHLQDMTVMTGHTYRETRFPKRSYLNQNLGPCINHEMNRCIQCYRCVRFYRDYAGGRDFNVFGAHADLYFGRAHDGTLENEFSGNLVEVCPTGVFTDKTLKRHYTRKWDLQTAPSVCVHCSVGCNTIPGERYGQLRRIRNRFNRAVNGYFLCDRGRYGYEFVNSNGRIHKPLARAIDAGEGSGPLPVSPENALGYVQSALSSAKGVLGIGSPRASLEANFALRSLVGPDAFYHGVSDTDFRLTSICLEKLRSGPAAAASLHDMESADAVLVLGEDVTNSAPMMALALRQSILRRSVSAAEQIGVSEWCDAAVRRMSREVRSALYLATLSETALDPVATRIFRGAPDDLARLGFAIAHELHLSAPAVEGLSSELLSLAKQIAQGLKGAQRPVIVSGTSCGNESLIHAASNVAWALCETGRNARLSFVVAECNSMGLGLMSGKSLSQAFQDVLAGKADTAIILENDLYRRTESETVNTFFERCKHAIVLDHTFTETASKADMVIPVGTFADADGTFVNNEGRGQRYFQVIGPREGIQESWRWLRDMMSPSENAKAARWETLDDVIADLAANLPPLSKVTEVAPPASYRKQGMKIARESHRASGRTAMLANVRIDEPKPPDDPDTALNFSMEGYQGKPTPALIPRFWAPGWNSVQAVNKFQIEVNGPLQGGDPGLRLIEPAPLTRPAYSGPVPPSFQPRELEWLVIPLWHIFGSEELSILAPAIAERSTGPYLGLNPEDAAKAGLTEGEQIHLSVKGVTQALPVKLFPRLPRGLAGLTVGLPGVKWTRLPDWGTVNRGEPRT